MLTGYQVAELNVETFTPEVVMYHGEVTHAPPPATSVDENLMPTMAGQQASTKEEYWLSVALHPSSMRPDGEEAEERDYSWNDLADCRHLVL